MDTTSRSRFLNRRKFLSLGFGVLCSNAATSIKGRRQPALRRFQRAGAALGTQVSLTVLHHDRKTAETALDASFAELETIEQVMSLYREDSQLRILNREGTLPDPHPHLRDVLLFAAEISKRSSGAFDVTIQPLWNLYWESKQRGAIPSSNQIEEARRRVDWRQVKIEPGAIQLRPGAAVTLNGIAQGFAVDEVHRVLVCHGIEHALVDCGEIGAWGSKPARQPWTVGIQHPRQPEAFLSTAQLADRCLATSGDYATSFTNDFRRNHLFDPRTGGSPGELASVTVAAPTGMQADALSTAISVLGVAQGLECLQSFPLSDALLVLKCGRILATENFPWTGGA